MRKLISIWQTHVEEVTCKKISLFVIKYKIILNDKKTLIWATIYIGNQFFVGGNINYVFELYTQLMT